MRLETLLVYPVPVHGTAIGIILSMRAAADRIRDREAKLMACILGPIPIGHPIFFQHLDNFVADATRLNARAARSLSWDLGDLTAFIRPIAATSSRTWPHGMLVFLCSSTRLDQPVWPMAGYSAFCSGHLERTAQVFSSCNPPRPRCPNALFAVKRRDIIMALHKASSITCLL